MNSGSERVLRRYAFLVLWGVWALIGWIAAPLLFSGEYDDWALNILSVVLLILIWLRMLVWEDRFRKLHLPPPAHRCWHARLVLVPLCLAALFAFGGRSLDHHLPQSYTFDRTSEMMLTDSTDRSPPYTFTTFEWRWGGTISGWRYGSRGRIDYTEVLLWNKERPKVRWMISSDATRAWPEGKTGASIPFNQAGAEQMLAELTGRELPPVQLAELAKVLLDSLALRDPDGATTFRRMQAEFRITTVDSGGSSTRHRLPWHWIAAGVFSLLLVPFTVFVIRVTMFPKSPRR